MNGASERKWQWTGGLAYVALFFYIFLLKPVPEQSLLREVTVDAQPAAVAAQRTLQVAVRGDEACDRSLHVSFVFCPFKTQVLRLATGKPVSPLSLLVQAHQVRLWTEPRGDRVTLKAEIRWRVRGGLLGKALDSLAGSAPREALLAQSLGRYKAAAEEQSIHRASLPSLPSLRPPFSELN